MRSGDSWSRGRLEGLGRVYETGGGRGPGDPVWRAASLARGFYDSLKIPRVDVVVSTGHNHSIPPALTAFLRGARLVLVEDVYRVSRGSRAVRLLSPLASVVALHWREQKSLYRRGLVVGPIYEPPKYEPWDGGYILVSTGTHGYKRLFDILTGLRGEWRLVYQTGRVDPDPYRRLGIEAFRFDPDIERWIAGARLVITHIGVTAVNAALAYRKPVVIVYNPEWSLAAPPQDAKIVADKIGAVFMHRLDYSSISDVIGQAVDAKPVNLRNGAARLAQVIDKIA